MLAPDQTRRCSRGGRGAALFAGDCLSVDIFSVDEFGSGVTTAGKRFLTGSGDDEARRWGDKTLLPGLAIIRGSSNRTNGGPNQGYADVFLGLYSPDGERVGGEAVRDAEARTGAGRGRLG